MLGTKRIEVLTPDQAALLPIWHQRWLDIGMDPRPIDRELATSAISRAYATINRPAPVIIFCDSPATSSLGIAVWPHLMASPKEARDSLGDSLRDSLGASLRDIANSTWFWGQHDAFWIAFYAFCAEIGVQYQPDASAKLEIMSDLAKSCGWIYMYEHVCFVSGRPRVQTIIEQRNGWPTHVLHAADEPAMVFADGYSVYAWRGVRIPDKYYLRAPMAAAILAEENSEVRRALMERYDARREKGSFLLDCGARVMDTAVQPMRPGQRDSINELLTIDLPGDPDGRMVALKVIDPSTGRQYIIRVPPDQKTVKSALAWTFNVPEDRYQLVAES